MSKSNSTRTLELYKSVAESDARIQELHRASIEYMSAYLLQLREIANELDNSVDESDEVISLRNKVDRNIEEGIRTKEQYERDLAASTNPNFNMVSGLAPFDIETLPDGLKDIYVAWLVGYELTKNSYYAIEIFTLFVRAGTNPPKWVLEHLAAGLHTHLCDPDLNPDRLPQCLGVKGIASGATNPGDQRKLRSARHVVMVDMGKLVSCFGFSQLRAANAVKIKHSLSDSPHTLKKQFVEFWGKLIPRKERRSHEMSEYDRTRFESSFPGSAKYLFR